MLFTDSIRIQLPVHPIIEMLHLHGAIDAKTEVKSGTVVGARVKVYLN